MLQLIHSFRVARQSVTRLGRTTHITLLLGILRKLAGRSDLRQTRIIASVEQNGQNNLWLLVFEIGLWEPVYNVRRIQNRKRVSPVEVLG